MLKRRGPITLQIPRNRERVPVRPALTTVGSLPPFPGAPEEAILQAVDLQRRHGFEILTDGEPRADMLSYFIGIPGVRDSRGVPRVVERIRPLDDPSRFSKVVDADRVKQLHPGAKVKVSLTGPATFALACGTRAAGSPYRGPMDPALQDDFVDALVPIAREIARRGAFLQIDEPVLSQGMREYSPALGRLDLLASEAPREQASVHVCGGLARSKVLPALLGLERVSILSLAFAGRSEAENRALLQPLPWEEHGKRLGAGCIDVQVAESRQVMEPEAVQGILEDVVRRVGPEHVAWVHPDCGLRGTPRELAPVVLKNLRRGFERAYQL